MVLNLFSLKFIKIALRFIGKSVDRSVYTSFSTVCVSQRLTICYSRKLKIPQMSKQPKFSDKS